MKILIKNNTVTEAQTKMYWLTLIRRVSKGETFIIMNRKKAPVAELLPADHPRALEFLSRNLAAETPNSIHPATNS